MGAVQVGQVDDAALLAAQLVHRIGSDLAERRGEEVGGVVDQRVQAAEVGDGLFHQVGQGVGVAQVGLQGQYAARAYVVEIERGLLQFGAGGVGVQHHRPATGVELAGDGRTDPARAAGDQDHGVGVAHRGASKARLSSRSRCPGPQRPAGRRPARRDPCAGRGNAVLPLHGAVPVYPGLGLLQRRCQQVRWQRRLHHRARARQPVRRQRGQCPGAGVRPAGCAGADAGAGWRYRCLRRGGAAAPGGAGRAALALCHPRTQRRPARAPAAAPAAEPAGRAGRARGLDRPPVRRGLGGRGVRQRGDRRAADAALPDPRRRGL
ncbi:hypothetical protein G6F35_013395 [Rhizopus arrhizus]|nr:hypothetical protein G6F35_013395 [Rhizopus arrhizus]